MKKVLVAMSGGVDSSVAAALLIKEGYEVSGGTFIHFGENGKNSDEAQNAKKVCDCLGIKHYVFDVRALFKEKVIDSFALEYDKGLTPNPCIECNKYIKFGAFLDEALKLGFDFIATGHYSSVKTESDGQRVLLRPSDLKKDQTYVLWQLSQEQLSHILMPLGDYEKEAVRKIAEDLNLPCAASKESQDICFVPDKDYGAFLEKYNGKPFEKGIYLDLNGKCLSENKGHQHYTIGQRKGLGIALGKPQFVISKDPLSNSVVLGDEEHLFKTKVIIKDVNIMWGRDKTQEFDCTAKLRYSAKDSACKYYPLGENKALLEFSEPQRAPSPGQSAVLYEGNKVIGGGKIEI